MSVVECNRYNKESTFERLKILRTIPTFPFILQNSYFFFGLTDSLICSCFSVSLINHSSFLSSSS